MSASTETFGVTYDNVYTYMLGEKVFPRRELFAYSKVRASHSEDFCVFERNNVMTLRTNTFFSFFTLKFFKSKNQKRFFVHIKNCYLCNHLYNKEIKC